MSLDINSPHLAYRPDFPKVNGYIIYPAYCPKHLLKSYEDSIREWCRAHDKKLWPSWLNDWAEEKKRTKA